MNWIQKSFASELREESSELSMSASACIAKWRSKSVLTRGPETLKTHLSKRHSTIITALRLSHPPFG